MLTLRGCWTRNTQGRRSRAVKCSTHQSIERSALVFLLRPFQSLEYLDLLINKLSCSLGQSLQFLGQALTGEYERIGGFPYTLNVVQRFECVFPIWHILTLPTRRKQGTSLSRTKEVDFSPIPIIEKNRDLTAELRAKRDSRD
jgi:hypothetical protein